MNTTRNKTFRHLSMALVIASMFATDSYAASTSVTYNGVTYDIGTALGTYASQPFNFAAQPWWNNYSLASHLAALVGSTLGTPNFNTQAPDFAYGMITSGTNAGYITLLYNNGNTTATEVQYSVSQAFSATWMYLIGMSGGNTITNLAAYNQTIMNAGSSVSMGGANMPNLTFEGAHHRTLLDSGLTQATGRGFGMWATADDAHYNSSNSSMKITEVGVYKDIHYQDVHMARIGIGVGQLWDRQGLMYDGHATYNGQYVLAEVDNMFLPHLEGSITGYYGNFSTKVSRNYEVGSGVGTSAGNTNTASTAVRLRVDMPNLTEIGKISLSPYAAYTWSHANVGSYTEAGGSFPVAYNGNSSSNNNVRVGLETKTALSASTKLVLNAEAVHSMEANTSGTSGQIIGLSTFSVAGQSIRQNWVRLMADVDHQLSDKSLITFGLNAGTQGGDPSYGGTISYHAAF